MKLSMWFASETLVAHLGGHLYDTFDPATERGEPPAGEPSATPSRTAPEARTDQIETGRFVEIRSGAVPHNRREPDTGLLLAALPAYGPDSPDGGTASVWACGEAQASGEATYFRVKDWTGHVLLQGRIADLGSEGHLVTDSSTVVASGIIVVRLRDSH